jgi:hypothetical protein
MKLGATGGRRTKTIAILGAMAAIVPVAMSRKAQVLESNGWKRGIRVWNCG